MVVALEAIQGGDSAEERESSVFTSGLQCSPISPLAHAGLVMFEN